jgi:hypothetical protein
MTPDSVPVTDGPSELGALLRLRRGELHPGIVGLDSTANRRVRGLRREEVAQLAMISTDYYTRLEQGHLAGASAEVLDALATALRLNNDERSYLYKPARLSLAFATSRVPRAMTTPAERSSCRATPRRVGDAKLC